MSATSAPTVTKIRSGLYRHEPSGRLIVQTDGWEGPRGGNLKVWEHAADDPYGGIVIDGYGGYRTLREAAKALAGP